MVSGQFFLGLPLFLFPPAFHAITCLALLPSSMRTTCPIHLNLLILMIVYKVSSPVIFLTSLLVTLSREGFFLAICGAPPPVFSCLPPSSAMSPPAYSNVLKTMALYSRTFVTLTITTNGNLSSVQTKNSGGPDPLAHITFSTCSHQFSF